MKLVVATHILHYFSRYPWECGFVQFDYWQLNAIYNPLIRCFDNYLP